MKKFSVFVLHRIIRDADGCEEMPVQIYSTPEKAEEAAENWFDMVKDMLTENNIEFEQEEDTIYAGEDSWEAWVETCDVERD